MTVLAVGHLCNDLYQGAVPALLPFLIAARGLSYTAAAGLVLAATVISSLVQPTLGHYSDRHPLPWLLPAGVLVGALGLALAGLAPSYPLLCGSVILSGMGVAAFHPDAARFATHVSGQRRASGMSLFAVAGNAGFALGPLAATPLVLRFGLSGVGFLLAPAALVALLLAVELPRLMTFRPAIAGGRSGPPAAPAMWGAFCRLSGVVVLRSVVYFGLLTFVPLYYVRMLGTSAATANRALAVISLAGAAGTLLGGRLADRVGRRVVVAGALGLVTPLLLGFLAVGPALGFIFLALLGVATIAPFSVSVVMGQEYLPGRLGIASGVTMGLAIGLGGVGAPLLGLVADRFGLVATLVVIAALPILAVALALTLPPAMPSRPFAPAALIRVAAREREGAPR